MADVNMDTIIDQLSNLTVMQIADLTKKLEEKWGVKACPGDGGRRWRRWRCCGGCGPGGGQTEFTVILANAAATRSR